LQAQLNLGGKSRAARSLKHILDVIVKKRSFDPTVNEQMVDPLELMAPLIVIEVTFNGGQRGDQGQFEGNNLAAHGARV
jgi:hypothetical protein